MLASGRRSHLTPGRGPARAATRLRPAPDRAQLVVTPPATPGDRSTAAVRLAPAGRGERAAGWHLRAAGRRTAWPRAGAGWYRGPFEPASGDVRPDGAGALVAGARGRRRLLCRKVGIEITGWGASRYNSVTRKTVRVCSVDPVRMNAGISSPLQCNGDACRRAAGQPGGMTAVFVLLPLQAGKGSSRRLLRFRCHGPALAAFFMALTERTEHCLDR